MGSGEDMITLSQQLKLLADGFRKRYGKTETLTLADMTKLVTPPAFPSGTDLLGGVPIEHRERANPFNFKVKVIPPAMKVPIQLAITCTESLSYLWMYDNYLTLNLKDGTQKKIPAGNTLTTDNTSSGILNFTIPANTSIANDDFILGCNIEYGMLFDHIDKIIATYVGGVINRLLSAFTSLIGGEAA